MTPFAGPQNMVLIKLITARTRHGYRQLDTVIDREGMRPTDPIDTISTPRLGVGHEDQRHFADIDTGQEPSKYWALILVALSIGMWTAVLAIARAVGIL